MYIPILLLMGEYGLTIGLYGNERVILQVKNLRLEPTLIINGKMEKLSEPKGISQMKILTKNMQLQMGCKSVIKLQFWYG
jgi:hypothetical protein